MKTATVRDLRNRFPRVAAWIKQGEPVEITRAGKRFARLVPAESQKPRRFKMPETGEVTARIALGAGNVTALVSVRDELWVVAGDGTLSVVGD